MTKLSNNVFSKGIFALAVVAITGSVGVVQFAQAQANNNVSGYGTNGQQASAAADKFQNSLQTDTSMFVSQIKSLEATTMSQIAAGPTVSDFDSKFNAASAAYENTTSSAFDNFRAQVTGFANTAESKDKFIDQFNHAKADYLNQLDAAKNQFAASLSPLGDRANQVKDQFMNGFNSNRDAYGNMLEQAKNDFANTVSNL